MGIFSRLSDIINSNLSAILERAEDPAKIIRLMVQEMEDTLVEVRATAARMIAEKKELGRRQRRLREAVDEWQRKAELALAKGREDLARGALMEKAKLVELAAAVDEELARLDEGLSHQEEDIARLEAKLREARARQRAIVARHEGAGARLKVSRQLADERIDEAFVRFEQLERRIDGIEGEAEAHELGRPKTLAEEIAELETEDKIQTELEELKAVLASPAASSRA